MNQKLSALLQGGRGHFDTSPGSIRPHDDPPAGGRVWCGWSPVVDVHNTAIGVCRIGRTGAGDGELWGCGGGMSRGPSRAQSGIGMAAEMGYIVRAVNDSQRSVHGRRLSRA